MTSGGRGHPPTPGSGASTRRQAQVRRHPPAGRPTQELAGDRPKERRARTGQASRFFFTLPAPSCSSWTSAVTCPRSRAAVVFMLGVPLGWFITFLSSSSLPSSSDPLCRRFVWGRTVCYISLLSHSATGDAFTATHSVFHSSCRPLLSRSSTVTEVSLAGLLHVEECVATTQLVLEVIFSGFSLAITSTLSWVAGLVVGTFKDVRTSSSAPSRNVILPVPTSRSGRSQKSPA